MKLPFRYYFDNSFYNELLLSKSARTKWKMLSLLQYEMMTADDDHCYQGVKIKKKQ